MEQLLGQLRRLATDKEFRRADLLGMRALITPSVVAQSELAR